MDQGVYNWIILPLIIFVARIADQTLGTLRIMYVSRGHKYLAPALGFFEVLIWILAIRQIMFNLSSPLSYLAWAGGFAMGNYMGIILEQKMAYGKIIIRLITRRDAADLADLLRQKGFGVTSVAAEGKNGPVNLLYSVIDRKDCGKAIKIIKDHHPKAFYTIESIHSVQEGIFPVRKGRINDFFPKNRKLHNIGNIYKRKNRLQKRK